MDYIVSKFGRFVTNKTMRNIIGQPTSAFDFRKAMDEKKIVLCNLSKGILGEEDAKFLGLILVPKILTAAMSRQNVPMEQRPDFFLYVDEFQNFATEDFAAILSEARKYRLNLIVANQFIGQIDEEIKNAVFGNVVLWCLSV
jgi:type IV secretory pathway TraG/TraD family ATPase VirD4